MATEALSLMRVYEGWEGHQLALKRAISGLSAEQLAYRPAPDLRSVGELVSHISLGRLDWFHRMGAPESGGLARQFAPWEGDKANTEDLTEWVKWMEAISNQGESIVDNLAEQLRWLDATWQMIETTLTHWTIEDLATTYRHLYQGKMYAVSRQWTIWRIMAHDLHHGGQIALALGLQGIEIPDLGDQGGHLTELPLAEPGS
jgi:uncharacterized damage-inducible protein DinB